MFEYPISPYGRISPLPFVGGRRASFPGSLTDLNSIFGSFAGTAVFSHAWSFNEASGNSADFAASGAIAMVPGGTPTQNVSTGLIDNDKGFSTTDAGSQRMAPAATSDLDVTTGSVVMLCTLRIPTAPASLRMALGKRAAGGAHYELRAGADGSLLASFNDGTNNPQASVAPSHVGTFYSDVLIICDRTSASKFLTVTTQLGDSGTVSASTLGSLTTATTFGVGGSPAASFFSPAATYSFFAWGTTPGTLVANRTAALAAWRRARGA